MPTAAERQALAFLAGVALLGGGVRAWQQRHAAASSVIVEAGAESVDGQLSAIDGARKAKRAKKPSARARKDSAKSPLSERSSARPSRGAAAGNEVVSIIDVDVATVADLEKLPRIGASLANRIVANRDSFGAFGSLEALGSVRGIGDAMLKSLDPLVTFSGRPRAAAVPEMQTKGRRKRKSAS